MPSVNPASMTLYLFLEKVTHSILCSQLKSIQSPIWTHPFSQSLLGQGLVLLQAPRSKWQISVYNPVSIISSYRHMGSMLFRAIVAPFHLLLDWPKSLFIFFCKMLWKNPNGLFGQSSISLGPFVLIYLFLIGGWLLYNTVLVSVIYQSESATVVQLLSSVWLFAIPWTAACQASLSFTVSQSLLKLRFIESVMPMDLSLRIFQFVVTHSQGL